MATRRRVLPLLVGPGLHGGIAAVERLYLDGLAESDADVLRPLTLYSDQGPLRPRRAPARLLRKARLAGRLWRHLAFGRVDTILISHVGLAAALPPRAVRRGARSIVIAHGVEISIDPEKATKALRRVDGVIAVSEHTAERVRVVAGDALKVRVVHSSLPRGAQTVGQRSQSHSSVILTVGRLDPTERGKGHDTLIRALPAVRRVHPDASLWIVGDGADATRLARLATEHACADSVVFHGYVDDATRSRIYSDAALFAMPSRQEGFGLVYLEAMANALPCIASNVDAGQEIVEHEVTGLTVPYDNPAELAAAIIALLDDATRASEMGAAGHEKVRSAFMYEHFRARLARVLDPAEEEPPCVASARTSP
jgi:phosphatidylinositol alpha-1,6-mannosyltransferase